MADYLLATAGSLKESEAAVVGLDACLIRLLALANVTGNVPGLGSEPRRSVRCGFRACQGRKEDSKKGNMRAARHVQLNEMPIYRRLVKCQNYWILEITVVAILVAKALLDLQSPRTRDSRRSH